MRDKIKIGHFEGVNPPSMRSSGHSSQAAEANGQGDSPSRISPAMAPAIRQGLRAGGASMQQPVSGEDNASRQPAERFSLVVGGPLYRILRRAHLDGSERQMLSRRITLAVLLTWVPLLLLSLIDGRALS